MKNDDNKRSNELSFPSRKSPRADFHDYSGGDYFITICTKNKSHYFGEITNGQMRLSPLGEFTTNAIDSLHSHYPYAEVRVSIVMPNHLHMIIHIDTEEKNTRLPKQRTALSVIVGGLKQSITCFAKRNNLMFGWQRTEASLRPKCALSPRPSASSILTRDQTSPGVPPSSPPGSGSVPSSPAEVVPLLVPPFTISEKELT